MAELIAYVNGAWLPQSEAGLGLADAGFVSGVTVVDLARTFGGRLFRWPQHLARFRQSCALVGIMSSDIDRSDAEWTAVAEELLSRNAASVGIRGESVVVVFATPGPLGFLAGREQTGPATVGLYSYPLPLGRYRALVQDGAVLALASFPAAPPGIDPRIKHRSRLGWWLADREANQRYPGAMALSHDGRGHLTETAIANFLLVHKQTVLSPRSGTILEGISRDVVRELCPALGLDFVERDLTLDDCHAAEEAFLCGTVFCLAGVRQIEQKKYECPGPILRRLVSAWSDAVG